MVHMAPHELPRKKVFYKQSGIGLRLQALTEKLKNTESIREYQGGFLKVAVSPCEFKIQEFLERFLFFLSFQEPEGHLQVLRNEI